MPTEARDGTLPKKDRRTKPYIVTDAADNLLCPDCGSDRVLIDDVHVAGRPEKIDGPVINVHVNNLGAVDTEYRHEVDPFGEPITGLSPSLRHHILLIGICAECGPDRKFAFMFRQNDGHTEIRYSPLLCNSL